MIVPWHTPLERAALHPSGWVRLPSGLEVVWQPLLDAALPLYARLTYRDALAGARALGGRLPTRAEVLEEIAEARLRGHVLAPVTLSYGPEMVTLEHAQEHDRRVALQLERLPAGALVAGIGKHWVAGAAPGHARICGWPRADGSLIQEGTADVHDDLHHDYATTTLVVRDPPRAA